MAFGYTWEYIDEYFTLPRLFEVESYWTKYPPLHVIARTFVEIKEGPGETGSSSEKVGTAEDLMREFGMAGGNVVLGRVDADLEP